MTECSKPVVRRCGGYVVTMAPEGIYIRRNRKRTQYGPLSYEALELKLGQLHADRAREEKAKAKGTTRRRRVRRGLLAIGR